MLHSALINVMVKAARRAGRSLKRDLGEIENLQVSLKGPANFVTMADRRAEEMLHSDLTKARPGYGFIGEEGGPREGADKSHTWIVDPLDGTTNFLHGIPQFAISIGLRREDTVIGTGMPRVGRGGDEGYLGELDRIMREVAGVRRCGSAALDLAWVASGRFDAFWEHGLSAWDVAAGILLVREAGGFVTDLVGGSDGLPRGSAPGSILAGNEAIHGAVLGLLTPAPAHR